MDARLVHTKYFVSNDDSPDVGLGNKSILNGCFIWIYRLIRKIFQKIEKTWRDEIKTFVEDELPYVLLMSWWWQKHTFYIYTFNLQSNYTNHSVPAFS